jgi:hypothetical protein
MVLNHEKAPKLALARPHAPVGYYSNPCPSGPRGLSGGFASQCADYVGSNTSRDQGSFDNSALARRSTLA